jgi:hypothetical protein
VRRFQIEQREAGVWAPTMNSIAAALRFFVALRVFFIQTIDRPDLAREPSLDATSAHPAPGAKPGRGRATAQPPA